MKTKEKELERILKALANQRRLRAFHFIKEKKQVSVGDVASHLKLSFKATSKHLTLMTLAGLLEKDQKSKIVFVSVSPDLPTIGRRTLELL
jgi:DNA-binding transcriptional ArsR family regulator